MEVIRAEAMGMCFGVRDALEIAAGVEDPRRVTIHGELVHNPIVVEWLRGRGFRDRAEARRDVPPETPLVLITAHGISDRERRRLQAAGKHLIDTTCPLVRRVHDAARQLSDEGYHVLVIGRRGHVEVNGIVEDLDEFTVIESPEEVVTYSSRRLGVICQTTAPIELVREVRAAIADRNPGAEVRFIDTVCRPTKENHEALMSLLEQVEAVVVVGGRGSNNTRALVDRCRAAGKRVWHVQDAEEIRPEWFDGLDRVGLTAGTSTLHETLDEVQRILEAIRTPLAAGW